MSVKTRIGAAALVILLCAWVFVGINHREDVVRAFTGDKRPADDIVVVEIAPEDVPEATSLSISSEIYSIPAPVASGVKVNANQKAVIDYSNAQDGYVMIRFLQKTDKHLCVLITGPSGVVYKCKLDQNGKWEVFPLSDGNGNYRIGVFEHAYENKYASVNSVAIDVTLKDEFAPFLRTNQYVNYNKDSAAVAKAAELAKGSDGLNVKVSAVYNFTIENISYDKAFAEEVKRGMHSWYVPDLDDVMERGKGICFDYAALMTSMLRSLGIPTRLVIGYAGDVYHAWIDVYSHTDGWINNAIYFDGKTWNLMDPTYASTGKQSADVMKYIGDGNNYAAKYYF